MNKHVFCNAHGIKREQPILTQRRGCFLYWNIAIITVSFVLRNHKLHYTTMKVEISKVFNHLFLLSYVCFINVTENGFRLVNTNKQGWECLFILFDCFSTYIIGAFYLVIANIMQCKRTFPSRSSFYHHVCLTDNSIAVLLNSVGAFNVKLNLCETFE